MQHRYVGTIAGAQGSLRHGCRSHQVETLMDLALPRFAGLGDGPRQIHKLWMVSADASVVDTSGVVDRVVLSSPCLNLDELSSSDDNTVGPVVLSHP